MLLRIRGGGNKSTKKKSSKDKKQKGKILGIVSSANDLLQQVKPATRVYVLLALFCTMIHTLGLPAPALFALDRSKIYEIWRPFTSVAYLGPLSMSLANSMYFLVRYGQTLEIENGTASHGWFLLVQTIILTSLGLLFGFPLQAQAMIAAIVYTSSRAHPMERIPFQFGLMITSYQLPFCMLAIDCLSQQSINAAWPHLLGIFSGHFYHFFTSVWPSLGGKARFTPPRWFIKKVSKFDTGKLNEYKVNQGQESSSSGGKKDRKMNYRGKKGRVLGKAT
eukprot:gene7483-10198_t